MEMTDFDAPVLPDEAEPSWKNLISSNLFAGCSDDYVRRQKIMDILYERWVEDPESATTIRAKDIATTLSSGPDQKDVSDVNVRQSIKRIRELLELDEEQVLSDGIRFSVPIGQGYRLVVGRRKRKHLLTETPITETAPVSARGDLSPRIQAFLTRNRVPCGIAIDEFIELETSPGWRGWRRDQVLTFPKVMDFEPSAEFERLMLRFPPEAGKPVNKLYSFN